MQDLISVPLGQATEGRCGTEVHNTINESFYVLKLSNRGLEIYHEVFAFRFLCSLGTALIAVYQGMKMDNNMIHNRIVHVMI